MSRLRALTLLLSLSALRCGPEASEQSARRPSAPVQILAISPSNVQVALGTAQPFTARGLLADGQSRDLTEAVRWSLRDETGQLLAEPVGPRLPPLRPGRYTLTAQLVDRAASTPVTITAATISSLAVSPRTPSVPKGVRRTFSATAKFSDGSSQDVTAMAAWSLRDTVGSGVASLGGPGEVTAQAVGKTRVQAKYLGKTSYTAMDVTPAALVSLALSPSNPSIAKGTSQVFTAVGTYSDGSNADLTAQVTWTVTDAEGSGVAILSSAGVAFAKAAGKATIRAELDGQKAETPLTVKALTVTSLAVTPGSASIAKGLKQAFTARATLSDGTTEDVTHVAVWDAVDLEGTTVAAVDSSGLVTSSNVGKASIGCSYSGQTASAVLQVTPATLRRLTLEPTEISLAKGLTGQLQALGIYTDGTTQDMSLVSTWVETDLTGSGVADVSASGKVYALAVGKAQIEASYGALSASVMVSVTAATVRSLAVSPKSVETNPGETDSFLATVTMTDGTRIDVTKTAAWSATDVSGSGVASIDRTGKMTASAAGRVEIRASYLGFSDTAQVTVGNFRSIASAAWVTLKSIWGSSDDDVWIGGAAGALLHWDGTTLTKTTLGAHPLSALWGTSARDVWAVTGTSDHFHFDGSRWTLTPVDSTPTVGLWGARPDDAWFVGWDGVRHWNGSRVDAAALRGLDLRSIWGSSASDIWAVGARNAVAHYDGTAWSGVAVPSGSTENFVSVRGSGARDVWVVASSGTLLHYDGSAWQMVDHPSTWTSCIAVRSSAEVWIFGDSRSILGWHGTDWRSTRSPTFETPYAAWVSPGGRTWAVGERGSVMHN